MEISKEEHELMGNSRFAIFKKNETSFPTVVLESFFMPLCIDAHEIETLQCLMYPVYIFKCLYARHVNIRYFFVKDRADKVEVDIAYCPTGQMLADFFTKPLQGSVFKKLKSGIMCWTDIDTLKV